MILDSPIISGSSTVTGNLTVLGTLTASVSGSVTSASYATNAETLDGLDSTSFTTTSSFTAYTASTNASILSSAQNIAILYVSSSVLDSRVTRTEATASSLTTASSSFSTRVSASEASISNLTTASSSFSTRTTNLETASGSFSTRTTNLETASGSFSTRVTNAESSITSLNSKSGSFATTGSNRFIGNQTITGSLFITENLTVLGSSSISYVSQSTLNIGTNLITVNAQNPSTRFGGLAVIDSGSAPQVSGSWLFDSIQDRWIMIHQQSAGAALTSSIGIMGPETYNNLGSETTLTLNRLVKGFSGASGEHIGDSNISDTGTVVSINSATQVTGSLGVTGASTFSNIVGINGTTNSSRALQVTQTSGLSSGIRIIASSGTNALLEFLGDGGSSQPTIGVTSSSPNDLQFGTGGSTKMILNSTGNLGLGVTPNTWAGTGVKSFQFQNGSLSASSTFGTWLSWNAYYDGVNKYVTSATAGRYLIEGNLHRWDTAPSGTAGNAISFTQAMTLNASGNLSIGNTNDTYKLDVSGTGRFSATSTDYALTLQNIQDDSQGLLVRATDNDGSLFLLKLQSSNTSTGQTWVDRFTVAKNGAATFSSSVTTGGDILINNSGETIANIRATSTQGGLSLWSGATADYNGGAGITLVSSDRSGTYTRGELYISAGRATNNTANGFIWFGTSDTERMRITSGGNVGIGTTSPSRKLVVNSGIEGISAGISGATYGIRFDNGGTNSPNMSTIHGVDAGLTGSYQSIMLNGLDVRFGTSDTERMRITSGGNVGIGTSSPGAKLDIAGTLRLTDNLYWASGDGVNWYIQGAANGPTIRMKYHGGSTDRSGALGWVDNGGGRYETLTWQDSTAWFSGNVGINTTSPYTKLHVNGSIGMSVNSGGYPINVKLVKQSVNTVTFTANVGTIGAWRPGYVSLRVATAQNGLQEYQAAWYFIRVVAYFASGAIVDVVDSGGNTGSYTFSYTATGGSTSPQVLTFTIADSNASTDTIIADIDFSYTEGIVSIS